MRKALVFVLAAAMAPLPLAGCGSSEKPTAPSKAPASQAASTADSGTKSAEGKTVVFIPKLTSNVFFESANAGAQKYSKGQGFTVSYQNSPSAAVADQVQVVNNAIASGADAICISSVDATGLDSVLKEAKDAGITVATQSSGVSSDARTLIVSQGTPDILGKMLVNMGTDSLIKRGKDVEKDAIKYCQHYSQATVADQNSWQVAGGVYIKENYPNWENAALSNYYSEQDTEKAVSIGSSILGAHEDIDLIICNDSTALPGQLKAAQNKGPTKDKVTITGFASPNSICDYAKANVIEQWGLQDCGIQGTMGCYLAVYLAVGNTVKVGDTIDIPNIGRVEVQPDDSLVSGAKAGDSDNGVILLPECVVFTATNVDDYNF